MSEQNSISAILHALYVPLERDQLQIELEIVKLQNWIVAPDSAEIDLIALGHVQTIYTYVYTYFLCVLIPNLSEMHALGTCIQLKCREFHVTLKEQKYKCNLKLR